MELPPLLHGTIKGPAAQPEEKDYEAMFLLTPVA